MALSSKKPSANIVDSESPISFIGNNNSNRDEGDLTCSSVHLIACPRCSKEKILLGHDRCQKCNDKVIEAAVDSVHEKLNKLMEKESERYEARIYDLVEKLSDIMKEFSDYKKEFNSEKEKTIELNKQLMEKNTRLFNVFNETSVLKSNLARKIEIYKELIREQTEVADEQSE